MKNSDLYSAKKTMRFNNKLKYSRYCACKIQETDYQIVQHD